MKITKFLVLERMLTLLLALPLVVVLLKYNGEYKIGISIILAIQTIYLFVLANSFCTIIDR